MSAAAFLEIIGGVRAAIFLAFALALAVVNGVQAVRLKAVKAQASELKASVATYEAVNKANVSAIEAMQERIKRMVDERRAEAAAAADAVAAAQASENKAKAKLAKRERELKDIYENNPNAAAWGNTGVDADVLRRLPSGSDQDR